MLTREQTRQNYDRMSRWYDLFAGSEKKFTDIGLQILGARIGEKVLEVGSGTGHSLIAISQQVGDTGLTVGVELSAGMIEIAKKRIGSKGVKIIQGDGTLLPFVQDSFEAVFLSFTLELFNDDEISILLKEIQRVLTPDGRLGVVSMEKKDVFACKLYEWGHARWPGILDCRPIEIKKHLEAGRFQVQALKVQTMWGLPVAIALASPG